MGVGLTLALVVEAILGTVVLMALHWMLENIRAVNFQLAHAKTEKQ